MAGGAARGNARFFTRTAKSHNSFQRGAGFV
jgi:hypothetical protein